MNKTKDRIKEAAERYKLPEKNQELFLTENHKGQVFDKNDLLPPHQLPLPEHNPFYNLV